MDIRLECWLRPSSFFLSCRRSEHRQNADVRQGHRADLFRKSARLPPRRIDGSHVAGDLRRKRGPGLKSIKQRVVTRHMPPWHLDKTVGIQQFENDLSLSDEQITTIARWVDAGAPQGDPKDMPPAKQWPQDDGWQLAKQFGQPDLVLKSEPYTMPAQGQDVWFKPLTEIPLTEPRWVRAVEMRPVDCRRAAGSRITPSPISSRRSRD